MDVLGIETSCDETAAAVVGERVRSDVAWSQEIHAEYGGVVPEIAAREHVDRIGAAVRRALGDAGLTRPDAVAVTAGPGLIGAVLVGLCYAKGLAAGWDVPLIAVNHLEGHLMSGGLDAPLVFPFLGLVVSGGHTAIYLVHGPGHIRTLTSTADDAAGEAYDKVAKMLGLPYPGGPVVDRLAAAGDASRVPLPRPFTADDRFSFSGLKSAVRNHLQRADRASTEDVCASFQAAVIDCLCGRLMRASRATGVRRVMLGGGVAANRGLRAALLATGLEVTVPPLARCTDNAAMIAFAGRQRLLRGERDPLSVTARAVWPLDVGP